MKIDSLQYITQSLPDKTHWQLAEEACEAGITWVQLRVKDISISTWQNIAFLTTEVCRDKGAKIIINDSPEIAKAVGADGLHLGKNDISISTARKLVGKKMIIGGTANTFDDIMILARAGADYIGLGPFRYTTTKANLSPILGLESYSEIIEACRTEGITIPIIAVGGILPEDVSGLKQAGVYGVAVSSAITQHHNKSLIIQEFKEQLQYASTENSR